MGYNLSLPTGAWGCSCLCERYLQVVEQPYQVTVRQVSPLFTLEAIADELLHRCKVPVQLANGLLNAGQNFPEWQLL
jgi:hypothetical protein